MKPVSNQSRDIGRSLALGQRKFLARRVRAIGVSQTAKSIGIARGTLGCGLAGLSVAESTREKVERARRG